MGADGTLLLMRYEQFLQGPYGDVNVFDIGLHRSKILGIEALSCYSDTNGIDDADNAKTFLAEREKELRHWMGRFQKDGSTHIVIGKPGDFWYRKVVRKDVEKELSAVLVDPDLPRHRHNMEALDWFRGNAESLTVWT